MERKRKTKISCMIANNIKFILATNPNFLIEDIATRYDINVRTVKRVIKGFMPKELTPKKPRRPNLKKSDKIFIINEFNKEKEKNKKYTYNDFIKDYQQYFPKIELTYTKIQRTLSKGGK